jgi:hypothetical protein
MMMPLKQNPGVLLIEIQLLMVFSPAVIYRTWINPSQQYELNVDGIIGANKKFNNIELSAYCRCQRQEESIFIKSSKWRPFYTKRLL